MRHLLAFEVLKLLIRAGFLDNDDQSITLPLLLGAFDCKRHRASEIYRETGWSGRKSADVKPPRAHRFDFGGVRLNGEVHHALGRAFPEIIEEGLECSLIDGSVFDRCVSEHQRARVLPALRVLGRIRDEILVLIAIQRVELTAKLAIVGLGRKRFARRSAGRARKTRANSQWMPCSWFSSRRISGVR